MRVIVLGVCAALVLSTAAAAQGSYSKKAYVTKSGTYVAPSRATKPNSTVNDNWSTKPNVNPYTGKTGTRSPSYGTYKAPKPPKSSW